ncbi:MAG TPA: tyrosine/phenylalanine carboxypeptidase domain-containing protein [Candidatus Nanoarchaeia archaeon]|nr:tyrosine/phenylalanine carboxypeptidase domain-containing protein [Candidatus Nanoarchaeia archaeon]
MDYLAIDRQLAFIHKKISSSHNNPLNLEIEKKKVLKDKTYNPVFYYEKNILNYDTFKNELNKIKSDSSVFGKLLKAKADELAKKIDLIKSVGSSSFSSNAVKLYGKPSPDLVKHANKFLDLENEFMPEGYNGISAIKKFLDSFLMYGMRWQVKHKEMIVGASFNVSKNILYINKNRKFTDHELKRLVVHEIGTHITRAENAKKQKYKLFLIGFPDYLSTEEGLAVYNEEKAGLLTNNIVKHYAGRVAAVDIALKNSFSTVYNSLLEFFPKEIAWNLTLRAKRGISNTSLPGAYSKDYVYLKGYYDVKNFVKRRGNLKDLYIGKIGIQHVNLIKQLNGNK